MPTCSKCGTHFPMRLNVGTKIVRTQNRKYCLSCSPFGQHNSAQLHGRTPKFFPGKSRLHGSEIVCALCSRKYIYNKTKGHLTTICNSCNANRRRTERKHQAVEYKGGECERCSYSRCIRALQFHHRDRTEKEFTVSAMMTMSWDKLRKELDKCDLLCSNCHVEEEDERIKIRLRWLGSTEERRADNAEVLGSTPRASTI